MRKEHLWSAPHTIDKSHMLNPTCHIRTSFVYFILPLPSFPAYNISTSEFLLSGVRLVCRDVFCL